MSTIDARDAILASIRGRLRKETSEEARKKVSERLNRLQDNLIPARARLERPELAGLFVHMAKKSMATVEEVEGTIPSAVQRYMKAHDLGTRLVIAPQSPHAALDWESAGLLANKRRARNGDNVALSSAHAGIAETGTLVLASGPANPVNQAFLPNHHIVTLRDRDLVAFPEESFQKLREEPGGLPRTVNWITGPSRSGDIGMKLMFGAHGPLTVHILLTGQWNTS